MESLKFTTNSGISLFDNAYKKGNYDLLYARYLTNVSAIVDLIRVNKNKSYVDLCGGTGAVARALMRRGARDITIVDLHDSMLNEAPKNLKKVVANVEEWKPQRKYDVIFCRQAITYLNLKKLEKVLWASLKDDGLFIFNLAATPNKSTLLGIDRKKYALNGISYRELTFLILGRAYHFQIADLHGKDFTVFNMYTEADIRRWFRNWRVEVKRARKASYFILQKKVGRSDN